MGRFSFLFLTSSSSTSTRLHLCGIFRITIRIQFFRSSGQHHSTARELQTSKGVDVSASHTTLERRMLVTEFEFLYLYYAYAHTHSFRPFISCSCCENCSRRNNTNILQNNFATVDHITYSLVHLPFTCIQITGRLLKLNIFTPRRQNDSIRVKILVFFLSFVEERMKKKK